MKILLLTATVLLLNCVGPMGPEGPQGQQGIRGKDGYECSVYIKSGILWSSDTNSLGNWDIVVYPLTDSSIVQVWVRMNKSIMWSIPRWYLEPKFGLVRIINDYPAKPGYEYYITCTR